jgi:hypothetical protein
MSDMTLWVLFSVNLVAMAGLLVVAVQGVRRASSPTQPPTSARATTQPLTRATTPVPGPPLPVPPSAEPPQVDLPATAPGVVDLVAPRTGEHDAEPAADLSAWQEALARAARAEARLSPRKALDEARWAAG